MTVPEALRDPQLRRHRPRRHRLHCAAGTLSIVAPAAIDHLLEGRAAERWERSPELPYWAEIWPASVALARHLTRGGPLAGCQALDLGCGVGVAGAAAAAMGADVALLDREPDALAFAAFNARQNGCAAPRALALDWARETADVRADRILMADVAYRAAHHEPLQRHLERCLAPDGCGLLTDPHRPSTTAFLERLAADGRFTLEEAASHAAFRGEKLAVRVVTIRWREGAP